MTNEELRQLQEMTLTEADLERRAQRRARGTYSTVFGEIVEAIEYDRLRPNAGVSADVTDHFVLLFREVFAEHPLTWVGAAHDGGVYTDVAQSKIIIRSVFSKNPLGTDPEKPVLEIGAFLGSRTRLGIGDMSHWSLLDGTRVRTPMNVVMVRIRCGVQDPGASTLLGDIVGDMVVHHQHDFLRGRLQSIGVPNIAYNIDALQARTLGFLPNEQEISAVLQFPVYVMRSSMSSPKEGAGRYVDQIVVGLSDLPREPLIDGSLYRAVHQIDETVVVGVIDDATEDEDES